MAQPRPPRGRQPTDEPGWWLASDGKWYPPESAPEPVIESLPPIYWHAPGYARPPEPKSTLTNVGRPAALVAEGKVAVHGSAPVVPETPPTTKRTRLWPKVAVAAALMLLIAAIGTVYANQRADRDATSVSAPKKRSAPATATTERTTTTTDTTTTTTTTTTATTATTLPPPPPTEAPTVAAPVPLAAPAPAPAATYYANCDAVRAAGAAPIYRGQPGYGPHLDRDGDGVGCE